MSDKLIPFVIPVFKSRIEGIDPMKLCALAEKMGWVRSPYGSKEDVVILEPPEDSERKVRYFNNPMDTLVLTLSTDYADHSIRLQQSIQSFCLYEGMNLEELIEELG